MASESTTGEWARALAVVDELLDLPADARAERLAALPAAERAQVERLLAADAASGVLDGGIEAVAPTLLSDLAGGATAAHDGAEDLSGRTIGAFTLEAPLGRGGMGEVYRARRTAGDVTHAVAFKILRRGMDSADIVRRFARERRILAQLGHPHIARFVDGGVADDGRSYYAMDLVDGVPVTAYAKAHGLDARGKVALIAAVADAVAFAHGRLVVHRDLKPSNILVDARGAPCVLDFGIAKLLDDTEAGAETTAGKHAMSPAYAAPEQILGEPIGVAADIYALGIVLFELLTGKLPHARAAASLEGLVRGLDREVAPAAGIDDDLDLIVQCALKRDPAERYASMAAFAADLRAWLELRPIAARPDSLGYRVGRFVRRHRAIVGVTALGLGAVTAALVVALWQAKVAGANAGRAEAAAAAARRQTARAETGERAAQRVTEFLQTILAEANDTLRDSTREPTVDDAVASAAKRVDAELADDPELQFAVLGVLGIVALGNADDATAAGYLERAFELQKQLPGLAPTARADAYQRLANLRLARKDLAGAHYLALDGLAIVAPALAADAAGAPRVAAELHTVVRAIRFYRTELDLALAENAKVVALRRRVLGDTAFAVGMDLYTGAVMLESAKRHAEAEAMYRQSLAIHEARLAPDDVRIAIVLGRLAAVRRDQGHGRDALELLARAIAVLRNHPEQPEHLATSLKDLGDTHGQLGQLAESRTALEEALAIYQARDPRPWRLELGVEVALGDVARNEGRFADAAVHHDRASAAATAAWGPDHVAAINTKITAIYERGLAGDPAAAYAEITALEPSIPDAKNSDPTVVARVRNFRGRIATEAKMGAAAVALMREAVALGDAAHTPTSPVLARIRIGLGLALIALGDPAALPEARTLLTDNLAILDAKGFGWDLTAKQARAALAAVAR